MHASYNQANDLNENQNDYERWLVEYGLSHALVRTMVEDLRDHVDMPPEFDAAELRPSTIHGYGLFATRRISAGELIAPARIAKKRTHAGRFTNHSTKPNARFVRLGAAPWSDLHMVALRQIQESDEVLMDYRQAGSVNGSGISPDRCESIETIKLRLRHREYSGIAELDLDQFLTGVLVAIGYLPSDLVSLVCSGRIGKMAEHVGYLRVGLFVGNAHAAPAVGPVHRI